MGTLWSNDNSIDKVDRKVKDILKHGARNTSLYDGRVGSNFNDWRKPVSKFARNEEVLAERLRENAYIGQYDISDGSWWKSCEIVEEITRLFHVTLKKVTARNYPGLKIGDFVKQGSSREGLKIRQPNEFDMILPFNIEGVDVHAVPALDINGELIPAHIKLQISDNQVPKVMNESQYRKLRTIGVFEMRGNDLFLNAKCFQTQIISSIMDTTIAQIQMEINAQNRNQACCFTLIKSSVFPPTFRFKTKIKSVIEFNEHNHSQILFSLFADPCNFLPESASPRRFSDSVIEFDIVPGLLLRKDSVPDPDNWFYNMTCDRYAVMKWVHKGRYADEYPEPNFLWRESSCGYEKHILDVSSRNDSDAYILTACRIIKAYLDGLGNSSPLSSLLSSYHIKNLAIHCILLQVPVSGVREALGYLIAFLEICLEMEFLPHYFYGNSNFSKQFPKMSTNAKKRRLNLFRQTTHDHFAQATLSLMRMKADLHGLFTESHHVSHNLIESFRTLCSLFGEDTGARCRMM